MGLSKRIIGLSAGAIAIGAAVPIMATTQAAASDTHTCTGTLLSPGKLAGAYHEVVVNGACLVVGTTTIAEDVTVTPNSTLVAANAGAPLNVGGDVLVEKNAAVILGCDAESPCMNNSTTPTGAHIHGDLVSVDALGVIMHEGSVGGDVKQERGGGGSTCKTSPGVFALLGAPVFSTYENVTVGGELNITDVSSCWLGVIRDKIGGATKVDDNNLADPDAIEILANTIHGELSCFGNSATWDNHETSHATFPRSVPENNVVGGGREGQCVRSSPMTLGGPVGPPGSF